MDNEGFFFIEFSIISSRDGHFQNNIGNYHFIIILYTNYIGQIRRNWVNRRILYLDDACTGMLSYGRLYIYFNFNILICIKFYVKWRVSKTKSFGI